MGTELTGYPVISVYEEFTSDPDNPRTGCSCSGHMTNWESLPFDGIES
jgi:hypothetical protein